MRRMGSGSTALGIWAATSCAVMGRSRWPMMARARRPAWRVVPGPRHARRAAGRGHTLPRWPVVDVAGYVGAVAIKGGRLDTGQILNVGVQPLRDSREVAADLVELDNAQRLVGTVVPLTRS